MFYILEFNLSGISESIRGIVNNGLEFLEKGFGVTLQSMAVQLVATLLLFLAVRFLLWGKITAIIEKRKQAFDDAIKAKDDALAEALTVSEETAELQKQIKLEANQIIENAKSRSYLEADKIINNAKNEAVNKLNNAEEEIKLMKIKAENEIKQEIVDVAYLMATKVMSENGKDDNDGAVKKALECMESSNGQ